MINGQKDTYDLVAEKVREYWKKSYPHDVVVFFEQKYDDPCDKEWIKMAELVSSVGDMTDALEFQNDFCEGQTMARNIKVVSLDEILSYYREKVIENE